jgi:DNA-binding response OmpR family regulator
MLARVRAVLRRQGMGQVAQAHGPERGGYRFDGWQLERRGRRLVDPNANPVALSKGEYALLLAFLEAPQRPSRASIYFKPPELMKIFSIEAFRSCLAAKTGNRSECAPA